MRRQSKKFVKNMYRKGASHERSLARLLYSYGFAVIRGPGSGSRSQKVPYPDLVAIKDRHVFVFEVKTMSRKDAGKKALYLPSDKIRKLKDFKKRSGGFAFIAVKILGTGLWQLIPIDKLIKTSESYYKLDPSLLNSSLYIGRLQSAIEKDSDAVNKILLNLINAVLRERINLEAVNAKMLDKTIIEDSDFNVKKYLAVTFDKSINEVVKIIHSNLDKLLEIGIPLVIDTNEAVMLLDEKTKQTIEQIATKSKLLILTQEQFDKL